MRTFIAVDIDEQIRKSLARLQEKLGVEAGIGKGDVKWVRPETVHLTLKFLGEIKDEKSIEVCNIVKEIAGRHGSFELNIEQVGCFGGKSARVLWVGTGKGCDQLGQLAKDIDEQLSLAGWPKETREFTGHLTLCRIKNFRAGAELAKTAEDYKDFKLGSMAVDSVVVYQSKLTPSGPIYIPLGRYELQ